MLAQDLTTSTDELFQMFEIAATLKGGVLIEPIASRQVRESADQLPRVALITVGGQGLTLTVERCERSEGCLAKAILGNGKQTIAELALPTVEGFWLILHDDPPRLDTLTRQRILVLLSQ